MLGNLLGGFIVCLVGVNLLPVVADAVDSGININSTGSPVNNNVGGASATIVGLVTLFYALGVMAIGIGVAVQGLSDAGLI